MPRSWIGIGMLIGFGTGCAVGLIAGLQFGQNNPNGIPLWMGLSFFLGLIGLIVGAVAGATRDLAVHLSKPEKVPFDSVKYDYQDAVDQTRNHDPARRWLRDGR